MNSPRMIWCCSCAGTGTGRCCAVVAYCWVGNCWIGNWCSAPEGAVLWQNVVPLGGLAGAVMGGFAGAGVVAVGGTRLAGLVDITAGCKKMAQIEAADA